MIEIRMLWRGERGLLQRPCGTSHPEAVPTAGTIGGWAKGKPIARGIGIHHNDLVIIEPYLEWVEGITGAPDGCPEV